MGPIVHSQDLDGGSSLYLLFHLQDVIILHIRRLTSAYTYALGPVRLLLSSHAYVCPRTPAAVIAATKQLQHQSPGVM